MHQVGRETPFIFLGAQESKPAQRTWCPCPPGQTRMKYDGTPDKIGVNPDLTGK